MKKVFLSGVIAAVLVTLLVSLPALAQTLYTNFDNVWVTADVTIGDDLTVTGDVINTPATAIAVTSGGTVTPTSSYVALSSAGTVGTSAIAVGTAGKLIYLVNTTNTTITFTDTGTLKLAGNAALGQYDTLTLRSDGTNWIEAARANN